MNSEKREFTIEGQINGLCFQEAPYTKTSGSGLRKIALPRQVISTIVWRSPEMQEDKAEYIHYGIHLLCDDGLIFLSKSEKPIVVDCWDCREESETAGNHAVVEIYEPSPNRILRIPRGIAHLPKNLQGVITYNAQEHYFDYRKLPIPPNGDVINILVDDDERLRSTRLPVARFPVPMLFQGFYLQWLANSLPSEFPKYYQD